jgi:putative copper resistance protein D
VNLQPQLLGPLVAAAALYGWAVHRVRARRGPGAVPAVRIACFAAALATLLVALVSPLDAWSDELLSAHMVQHLLLTLVAPPLLLLGRPITLALGSTSGRARAVVAGAGRSRVWHALTSPLVGFTVFGAMLWVSHFSGLYELTLTHEWIHALEHLGYLGAGLLFWWPVVARDPGAERLSSPARVLYVFLPMPVMSLLGLAITSADRVLYPHYAIVAPSASAALADQRLAGTIMWVSGMFVGVVTLSLVLVDWMIRDEREAARADARRERLQRTGPEPA